MTLKADLAPPDHGGNLGAARQMFPGAPEPFLDLSTGINPYPYPLPPLPPEAFTRLPDPAGLAKLAAIAAEAYGAPSPAHIVVASSSQILVVLTAFLLARGRASILAPTSAELAGHNVVEVAGVTQLAESRIAIVVNPNNPDGRVVAKDALLALAERLRRRGGLLLVDEAFTDVGPYGVSLADQVGRGNIMVLRSCGKFYGLAGLRLSFAIAPPEIATRIATGVGPWPVGGAALDVGAAALAIWPGGRRPVGLSPRRRHGSMACSPSPGSRLSGDVALPPRAVMGGGSALSASG